MWPLLFISIVSLACIFERLSYWRKSFIINDNELNSIINRYATIKYGDHINTEKNSLIPLENVLYDSLNILDNYLPDEKYSIDIKLKPS